MTTVGFDMEKNFPAPKQTQCQEKLSFKWSNFKSRFLGLSLTDGNCDGDICLSVICLTDIFPYGIFTTPIDTEITGPILVKIASFREPFQHVTTILVLVTFVQAIFILAMLFYLLFFYQN